MQALKFRVGQTIRRDSVPTEQLTFASLLTVFQELFGRPLHNETLRYRDDESEWIDISTDRELKEALRLTKDKALELTTARTPFRDAYFKPNSGSRRDTGSWGFKSEEFPHRRERHNRPHKEPSFDLSNRQNRFRHHAICDNCNTQIFGIRHKCNECLDYDLCSDCIDKSDKVHPGHTYTALARSYARWHHRRPARLDTKEEVKEEPTVVANTDISRATEECRNQENEEQQEVAQVEFQVLSVVPPAPAAQPAAQPLTTQIIREALHTLAAMGFEDKQKNVGLILAFGGDLDKVLEQLLTE